MRIALSAVLLPLSATLAMAAWWVMRSSMLTYTFRVAGGAPEVLTTAIAVGTVAGLVLGALVGAAGGAEAALAFGAGLIALGLGGFVAIDLSGDGNAWALFPGVVVSAVGFGSVRPAIVAAAVRAFGPKQMHGAALVGLAVYVGINLAALVSGLVVGLPFATAGALGAAGLAALLALALAAGMFLAPDEPPSSSFDGLTAPFSVGILVAWTLAQVGFVLAGRAEGPLFYANDLGPFADFANPVGVLGGALLLALALGGSLVAGFEWPRGSIGGVLVAAQGVVALVTLATWWALGGLPMVAVLAFMAIGGFLEVGGPLVQVGMLRGMHWRATTALAAVPVLAGTLFRLLLWMIDVEDPTSGLVGAGIVLIGAGLFVSVLSWLAYRSRRQAEEDAAAEAEVESAA